MKAMILEKVQAITEGLFPLAFKDISVPIPREGEVRLRVTVCGVCHTELDEIEGRTPPLFLPVVPGHQVVGIVDALGIGVTKAKIGDRVGVAWIFSACGHCSFCLSGQENLCAEFLATGRDVNGGYAQFMTVSENFIYQIPQVFSDAQAAPLLCAGAIGYRSLRLANLNNGESLGLAGFGASAHIVLKLAQYRYPQSKIFVFSRSEQERRFAGELGAYWSGSFEDTPPQQIHAVIDTTPVWKPILISLQHLEPGGRLVINAIRKEEIDKSVLTSLDYPSHLWMEKEIKSVANVSRADVSEFLSLAAKIPIYPEYQEYPLVEANQALIEMKTRKIRGAKVLRI